MKRKDVFISIFIFFFIIFMGLYLSSRSGYYEEEAHNKTILTKEQISIFEQDIESGKEVDIKEYLKVNEKNYNNKISSITLTLSNLIGNTIKKSITYLVKSMSKVIE